MNNFQLLFIMIVTNAGGEGKTFIAQLCQALLRLAGQPAEILDGDAGNAAAKIYDNNVRKVGWGVGPSKAMEIVETYRGGHLIADLGANTYASNREIVDLLPALQEEFGEAGYRSIVLMPVSPNKSGAVEAIQTLAPKLKRFEQVFIRNNRDGSGNFLGSFDTENVVDLGYFQPGFKAVVDGPGRSLERTIRAAPEGYQYVSRFAAEWAANFARQPNLGGIFDQALPLLDTIPAPRKGLRYTVYDLKNASDTNINKLLHKSYVQDLLNKHGWNEAGLRLAAAELSSM